MERSSVPYAVHQPALQSALLALSSSVLHLSSDLDVNVVSRGGVAQCLTDGLVEEFSQVIVSILDAAEP